MTDRFKNCVAFVLAHETEFDHDGNVKVERDPHDPGGTTKYGIDQRAHPDVNVAALTKQQAIDIYHDEEWTKGRCENLKQPWDLAVFDTAVNIGTHRTVKLLQQTVGAKVDGFIGPVTIAKTNGSGIDAVSEFLDLRESYYRSLPEPLRNRFLKGWLNRLADVRKTVSPLGGMIAGGPSIISKGASGVIA